MAVHSCGRHIEFSLSAANRPVCLRFAFRKPENLGKEGRATNRGQRQQPRNDGDHESYRAIGFPVALRPRPFWRLRSVLANCRYSYGNRRKGTLIERSSGIQVNSLPTRVANSKTDSLRRPISFPRSKSMFGPFSPRANGRCRSRIASRTGSDFASRFPLANHCAIGGLKGHLSAELVGTPIYHPLVRSAEGPWGSALPGCRRLRDVASRARKHSGSLLTSVGNPARTLDPGRRGWLRQSSSPAPPAADLSATEYA